MRRKEKEIIDKELINAIIRDSDVCRLGLSRNDRPYVVPVSFGYDGEALYFHTAGEGKKLDYIAANDAVCFEFERGVELVPHGEDACGWTFSFQSVIGYGRIQELVALNDKNQALIHIIEQYTGDRQDFSEKAMRGLRVWKIDIEELTGKQSGKWVV
jgi:nitroimidazol reductase NimA-like FMN-containing flavoprotein (pyridoxamine 5'-phosphate oxidase superfamily)